MKPRHSDTDPGWIRRELKEIRRLIRESNAAKRLQAATIGAGGVTVKDGGRVNVQYPSGPTAFQMGPFESGGKHVGSMLQFFREDGERTVFQVARVEPGLSDDYPDGLGLFQAGVDQFIVGTDMFLVGGGVDGGTIYMDNASGITLSHPLGVGINHATTAAAANCYIDPVSYRIYRVSSSERYKQDITTADVDVDAVLALVPRAFRRKDEVEELGDDAPTYVGFVAEEAADLGLDAWVTSDEEGPESFSYSQWGVAQQAVLRAQQSRLNDLEQRLEALEARA